MDNALIHQIETHVAKAMSGAHEREWPFHNIHHVTLVVVKCVELAQAHNLDQRMTDELLVAAWFHDIGYVDGSKDHELRSARMCAVFLDSYKLEPTFLQQVSDLILATKYPSHPANIQQKILCDADLYHLASDQYSYWADRLFQEINRHQDNTKSKQAWLLENIVFFQDHSYFTDYAQRHWTPQKLNNLFTLKQGPPVAEKDTRK